MREAVLNWSRARKRLVVMSVDATVALASVWLAFTLRLDVPHRPAGAEWAAYVASPWLLIAVFAQMGVYRAIFRHTGMAAIVATGKAVSAYGVVFAPLVWALFLWDGVPRSLIVLQPLILLVLVAASRALGWRWLVASGQADGKRLIIYGAGRAGAQTAAALAGTRQHRLLGFVDDDPSKVGRSINGVPVHSAADTAWLVQRMNVSDVLLALPSVARSRRNAIIAQLQSLPVRIRSLPGVEDLASGKVAVDDFQDLDVEDLLGREPVQVREEWLARSIGGRVVLVTGAGGSIGSELCRQIVREGPKTLLLVEHSEFALYRVYEDLLAWVTTSGVRINLQPLLVDVCNYDRVQALCRRFEPELIYHAAAYKHVPIVEINPGAGVVNNVLGTLNLARAALDCGAKNFVLVSTDKAVRPTNIMGASKRVAEQVLQSLADGGACTLQADSSFSHARTCFSMVRFGNVLGSSGSVVPLFRKQISGGGPITVTHADVTRYFMTIPEAAQLVLHAGAIAQEGDLFVLDMGVPVRILDLAKRMVALSGLTIRDSARPQGDIEIHLTGLRPGEKLYEELLIGENPMPTQHPRITRAREVFTPWPELSAQLDVLLEAAQHDDVASMIEVLQSLVPGFVPRRVAATSAASSPSVRAIEPLQTDTQYVH